MQMSTLITQQAVQDVMATEQSRDFRMSTLALTAGLLASVSFALVASVAILLVHLRIEQARIKREAQLAKARRLRMKAKGVEVQAPSIKLGVPHHFHIFLSHVWGSGQDQMRIIKQRLKEMVPDLEIFLDVDDLEEIGNLEGYIERTSVILIYCSKGYFQSRNCIREFVATVAMKKPIIALIDPEVSHGGLSIQEVRTQLTETDEIAITKWGFKEHQDHRRTVLEWHGVYEWPGSQKLYDALFANETIEWNRIGIFQDVTMRLIAERVLHDADGSTYVDGELISRKLKALPPPSDSHKFHICCSALNPGALALVHELAEKRGFDVELPDEGGVDVKLPDKGGDPRPSPARRSKKQVLYATSDTNRLTECDHLLLYLTSQTWTRGEASVALAAEVHRAMDLKVHVLLAHEMPGAGGQEARFGCEFGSFFSCVDGATPDELLQRNIYSEVAIALKGGPWREASMAVLAMAFGLSKEEAEAIADGNDVLDQGVGFAVTSVEWSVRRSVETMQTRVAEVGKRLSFNESTTERSIAGTSPELSVGRKRRSTSHMMNPLRNISGRILIRGVSYRGPPSYQGQEAEAKPRTRVRAVAASDSSATFEAAEIEMDEVENDASLA